MFLVVLFPFLQRIVSVTASVFFSFSQWSLARVAVVFVDEKGFVVAFRILPAGLHGFSALPLCWLVENLNCSCDPCPPPHTLSPKAERLWWRKTGNIIFSIVETLLVFSVNSCYALNKAIMKIIVFIFA